MKGTATISLQRRRRRNSRPARLLAALTLAAGLASDGAHAQTPAAPGAQLDRGDNALWMRRRWLHESPPPAEIAELVESLRARGVRRIYPFLGPMDTDGWPGWRSGARIVRYVPEHAAAFLAEIHRLAPEIKVIPWTGGVLDKDVRLKDPAQRQAFAEHARRLVELGADGVQLNIEPLPSNSPGYRALLKEVKAAIGKQRTLSVAAYPPPSPLHPHPDVHWDLSFMRSVCEDADELAVMAYDTAVTSAPIFEELVATWTRELAAALPPPSAGGCEWLMGVSAYDDDKDYHRPEVETIEHSLKGIQSGLSWGPAPDHFRGVAIYASFTTDERKWSIYDRLWRGVEPVTAPPPDVRPNAPE